MSIHDNIAYGPRIHGVSKKDIDGIVEASLRSSALWGETSDRLKSPCPFVELRATAEAMYCQDSGSKAQNHSFRWIFSALDPVSTSKIEELIMNLKKDYKIVTHNMQQAARVSDYTGFFLMSWLIEFGQTSPIFYNPRKQITEDYITGMFGWLRMIREIYLR